MNVPGGTYIFRVIACNNDGFWNTKGASIGVKIIPPLHRTWWFRTLSLLVFAVVFYLLVSFIRKYFYLFAFWKKKSYIGQYVIDKLIGCGAMAEVFKAHHLLNKKKIAAVKILKGEYASRELSKKRFKQEGAIIDRLEHPNIVKIFARGQQEDNLYIVMEYLEGQTLADRIKEEKIIKIPDFLEIMSQLAGVLSILHDKNIMHRDLKPANIMLINREGTRNFVKLLDFGLARSSYHTRLTESGSLLGTILYIPPEQITHSVFSPAGDIYALGIIAYEMLTGMIPFTGVTDLEIIQMKLKEEPVEPGIVQIDIPPALNNLIKQMIARDFKARPTAETLVWELKKSISLVI
jgi:serine/threonine-protein kinase